MGKVVISKANLTNIANAIREKTKTTNKYKPVNMADAIKNLYANEEGSIINDGYMSLCDDTLGANCTKLLNGVTSIGDYAFYYRANLTLTEIPNSVTSIGEYAFYYCTSLSSIELSDSLVSINKYAFYSCDKLTTVILRNITSVPSLGSSAFSYTPIANSTGYIYVPDALIDSFKIATNWSTYASQIKGVSQL